MIYPFANFNGCIVEVLEYKFTPYFTMDVIIYAIVKGIPDP